MKLINLTPHIINISGHESVAPSGYIARVNTQLCQIGDANGIPLMSSKVLGVSNIPDEIADTLFIVAGMVRMHLPFRKDLASPSKLIRNEHGAVVACGALEVNP